MATYTKNPEIVSAVQWSKTGDHAYIVALNPPEKRAKELCTSCGRPLSEHGKRELDESLHDTICPGWWVITREDGRIEYLTDAKFQARYTAVKESANG